MVQIENMWRQSIGRRKALLGLSGVLAGSALLKAQQDPPSVAGLLKNHLRALGIDEIMTAFDFEPVFKSNVSLVQFDFVAHASDSEWTMLRNREAFGWVDIVPRSALNVSAVNLSTELFGVKLDSPFFVAPAGLYSRVHPEGIPAMRRGTSDAKTLWFVPSEPGFHEADRTRSIKAWNDTVKAGNYPFFWQFYPDKDLKAAREVLEKMQADGARAIAVTSISNRPITRAISKTAIWAASRLLRSTGMKFTALPTWIGALARTVTLTGAAMPRMQLRHDATPRGAGGIRGNTSIKSGNSSRCRCWRKASLYRKMPSCAFNMGSTVFTSRTMEAASAITLDKEGLPGILAAVRGRVPVLFDGGVRHGIDVFKALALGAKAVGLGRAPMRALQAGGDQPGWRPFKSCRRSSWQLSRRSAG